MHLFSTPVQCTQCGTVVDDPTVDKCPKCGNLLKERRTPSRLAGVERRYGQLRLLLGVMRFLGVITIAVGILFFMFSDDQALPQRVLTLLGPILLAVGMFVLAALIDVALDIEENTRSTFRVQQQILEKLEGESDPSRVDARR